MKKLFLFLAFAAILGCKEEQFCEVKISGKLSSGDIIYKETEYAYSEQEANDICDDYKNDPIFKDIICRIYCQ
jgi:hypothetical protein